MHFVPGAALCFLPFKLFIVPTTATTTSPIPPGLSLDLKLLLIGCAATTAPGVYPALWWFSETQANESGAGWNRSSIIHSATKTREMALFIYLLFALVFVGLLCVLSKSVTV